MPCNVNLIYLQFLCGVALFSHCLEVTARFGTVK